MAVILAACVLSFFLGGIGLNALKLFLHAPGEGGHTDYTVQVGALWSDLVKVLIGGLIGYVAGGGGPNDKKTP